MTGNGRLPCIGIQFTFNRKRIDELRRLERRRGRSGKDSIDHPPHLSDDIANSVAGAVNVAITRPAIDPRAMPTGVERGTDWLGLSNNEASADSDVIDIGARIVN
jgi:hypothetical protein